MFTFSHQLQLIPSNLRNFNDLSEKQRENKPASEARYIHGERAKGFWTFYGGYDPEDYRHLVGDPPTDLNLHPNSPGYRLILNNVLFPAVKKKKKRET